MTTVDKKALSSPGYFDVNLTAFESTITGGYVTLYTSTNQQASITSGDMIYVANIPFSEINATVHDDGSGPLSGFYNFTYNGMTFYLGNQSIVGPAPTIGGTYYIKAEISTLGTPVYVSAAQVRLMPNIIISPTSGGAGTPIAVTGLGFTPSTSSATNDANLTWTYLVTGASSYTTNFKLVPVNSTGGFTTTVSAPELKLETPAGSSVKDGTIYFNATDVSSGVVTPTYTFTEYPRVFDQIIEYNTAIAGWSPIVNVLKSPQLNYPAYNNSIPGFSTVPIYENQQMIIAGGNFTPDQTVTIYFGSQSLGTATTNATGFFNVTVTMPVVANGTYDVKVVDPLAYIYFNGTTRPEVVVTPSSVAPGQTVTVSGYAFAANNVANVTWVWGFPIHTAYVTSAANTTTNSLGEFSASYTIPTWAAGGTYVMNASTNYANPTAYALFEITPTMTLSQSTASLGTQITATAYGLGNGTASAVPIVISYGTSYKTTPVTLGHSIYKIGFAYDNVPVFGSNNTYESTSASVVLQAAGYPMVHYVQLYNASVTPFTLLASAPLSVTGTTNVGTTTLNQINSTVNQISSQVSSVSTTLTGMQTTLTGIQSSLTSLQTAVGNLGSALSSDYNSLSSSLGSVSSSLSSMSSTLSSVSSTVSTLGSSLSSMSSTLSSVQSEAAQISTVNSLVLATIVIAIIVLVLEIVVLIRRR
ncbi:Conserved protein [Conexivisphaera calida]|uniref:Conserved protein n=1 Tax=Conexivisphaera calida TaxID=1874277 RepID=A0A4P2VKM0_9ARCH|nr:Conserved protein [Conexivisphaera calida]